MGMTKLLLENFRCFAGKHDIPLRPLTLLVGENSSGKTSVLAGASVAYQLIRDLDDDRESGHGGDRQASVANQLIRGLDSQVRVDFNEPPFELGSYDEIATNQGKAGPVSEFEVGAEWKWSKVAYRRTPQTVRATFVSRNSRPTPAFRRRTSAKLPTEPLREDAFIELPSFSASAPVRAQPQRTYHMTSDIPRAQGDHVPVLLADIYGSEDWKAFADKLHRYSTSAGLFRELAVKRLGRKPSDPFQIRVKSNGAYRNLVDVGYGVCQVLPLVHDVIRKVDGHCFLLQQPEVHLHPRAQAELGTLFGLLAKEDDKQFLVETHSDYLVDRIRIDVRKGNVAHEDVVILYFELGKNGVQVHPIFVDPRGQLIDPPPTYRQFFLEEERRFLGLD